MTLRWVGLKTDRRSQWMRQLARAPRQKPHGRGGGQQKCPDCLGAVDEPPGPISRCRAKDEAERGNRVVSVRPTGDGVPETMRCQAYEQLFDLSNDKEKPSRTMRGVIAVDDTIGQTDFLKP